MEVDTSQDVPRRERSLDPKTCWRTWVVESDKRGLEELTSCLEVLQVPGLPQVSVFSFPDNLSL